MVVENTSTGYLLNRNNEHLHIQYFTLDLKI